MAIGALTLAGLNFALYILLRATNRWLAYLQLFLLFIFAFIVSDKDFSIFYLLLFIIAIIIAESSKKIGTEDQSKLSIGRTTLLLTVGVVMYIAIATISTQVGGNIIGTPDLAFHTTESIKQMFKPTLESSLGIIENFFIFTVFEALVVYGLMIPFLGRLVSLTFVVPLFLSAFIMGIFHVAAYSVSVSLIIWATMAFAFFIASWYFLKDSLAADTAHYLNNLIVSSQRNLQVVF